MSNLTRDEEIVLDRKLGHLLKLIREHYQISRSRHPCYMATRIHDSGGHVILLFTDVELHHSIGTSAFTKLITDLPVYGEADAT